MTLKRKPVLPGRQAAQSSNRHSAGRTQPGSERREPIKPGYELMRLRLQYAHKGARPLARIP